MGTETREREERLLRHRTLKQDHIRECSTTGTVQRTGDCWLYTEYVTHINHSQVGSLLLTKMLIALVHVRMCIYTLTSSSSNKTNSASV